MKPEDKSKRAVTVKRLSHRLIPATIMLLPGYKGVERPANPSSGLVSERKPPILNHWFYVPNKQRVSVSIWYNKFSKKFGGNNPHMFFYRTSYGDFCYMKLQTTWYQDLVKDLKKLEYTGIVLTKWNIGKRIIADELKFGKPEYGSKRIENLAKDLGVEVREVYRCIQFAKKCHTVTEFKDTSLELGNYVDTKNGIRVYELGSFIKL